MHVCVMVVHGRLLANTPGTISTWNTCKALLRLYPWAKWPVLSCTCIPVCLQAAATPPDEWLFRNVYMKPDNVLLRTVEGEFVQPAYDPTYAS